MDPRRPQSRLARLISRIKGRISIGTFGRTPRARDFQRQYTRKAVRCHRMIVSGWTMVMAFNTDDIKARFCADDHDDGVKWIRVGDTLFVNAATAIVTVRATIPERSMR